MSDPFIGEIKMFAGNFAPRGWAFCDGQLLQVNQNDALFALIGTIYGGDGRVTFALPDMRGKIPLHQGFGPGLTTRRLGSAGGLERNTLTVSNLPPHDHSLNGTSNIASDSSPIDRVPATAAGSNLYNIGGSTTPMDIDMIGFTGGTQSHTNLMPFLCIHFIIALVGIFPSRQ